MTFYDIDTFRCQQVTNPIVMGPNTTLLTVRLVLFRIRSCHTELLDEHRSIDLHALLRFQAGPNYRNDPHSPLFRLNVLKPAHSLPIRPTQQFIPFIDYARLDSHADAPQTEVQDPP